MSDFLGARGNQGRGSSASYPASHVDCNFCIFQYFALVGTDVHGNQPKIFYTEALISPQTWKTCDRPEVLGDHAKFSSPTQPEIFEISFFFFLSLSIIWGNYVAMKNDLILYKHLFVSFSI